MCAYLYGTMYPAPLNPWVRDTQEPLRNPSFERTTYDDVGDQFNHLNRSGGTTIWDDLIEVSALKNLNVQQDWISSATDSGHLACVVTGNKQDAWLSDKYFKTCRCWT